jgi:hypothetical protein
MRTFDDEAIRVIAERFKCADALHDSRDWWDALRSVDRDLADAIEASWRKTQPCFASWFVADDDETVLCPRNIYTCGYYETAADASIAPA